MLGQFNKILIFGRPGSGKSTFSVQLGQRLKLPVYSIDRYFFVRNWKERAVHQFLAIQKQLIQRPQWIIEGNALATLEIRYAESDCIFYFYLPAWLCLWRVLKRRFFDKDSRIKDRAAGCREILRWSLVRYLWHYEKYSHFLIKALQAKYPKKPFFYIKNDREALQFLQANKIFNQGA